MAKLKIDWIKGDTPPKPGMYRIQDHSVRCNCCWMEARFNGKIWLTNLHCPKDIFMMQMNSEVTRWSYPIV